MITFIFPVHLLIWIFAQMRRLFVVYSIEMDFLITPCLVCFYDFIISHNLTMLLLFQDLRIATTVAVVIGLFVICWTPFFGINFAFAVCIATLFKGAGCPGLMTLPTWILSVNKWLQYGNSVCNPVIYGFGNKDFRRAFVRLQQERVRTHSTKYLLTARVKLWKLTISHLPSQRTVWNVWHARQLP